MMYIKVKTEDQSDILDNQMLATNKIDTNLFHNFVLLL